MPDDQILELKCQQRNALERASYSDDISVRVGHLETARKIAVQIVALEAARLDGS